MKSATISKFIGAGALAAGVAFSSLPASAQTGTGTDTTTTPNQTATTESDRDFDWGWLGLLGLAGLAGLAGKKHHDDTVAYRDPNEVRTGSTRY